MLTTTLRELKNHHARDSRYMVLTESLGGEKNYGLDTELTLLQIRESNGLADAIWALRASNKPELARFIAADFAEHVLDIFEKKYPNDKRPRLAIEAARMKKLDGDKAKKAADAAAAAADADAEQGWQIECFKKWITDN